MTLTASEVKNHFGEVMEKARKEPITVSKSGRDAVAILDIEEYHRLLRIENDHWATLADKAKEGGMVGTDAAMNQLTELLQETT